MKLVMSVHQEAQFLLNKTDLVALRCVKSGISYPAEWKAYTDTLRAIAAGNSPGPIPVRPDYPEDV